MELQHELFGLFTHSITCLSTVACVYILGRTMLPVVVRVLEFLDERKEVPVTAQPPTHH